ncbi:cytosine permease [Govanella unica]|uniref:Cytosine permease n=1 Tax=Govanella unica TaxID=2975056 RepID=A0A9X3TZA3_9PROT|nr:cytosine permease [Govania unica]MDA5194152.1 cytosine permease [Govania unica]
MSDPKTTAGAADDFSRQQVPDSATYSGFHIALVIISGTIAIPAFMMAAQIGNAIGLSDGIKAFMLGCLVLGSMGALTSYVGSRSRYSTYMLTAFAFGRSGAKLVNLVIALVLVGWFGVLGYVFAQAAHQTVLDLFDLSVPLWVFIIIGSGLKVAVTIAGFKGIDILARFLVPLLALLLGYAAFLSFDKIPSWSAPGGLPTMTFSIAVSAVIGSYIAGVIIQPDYSRFARKASHALWAAFIALGVSFPLVQFLSAVPSVATGQHDLIIIMIALGIGVPAFLLLLLSSWSSNVLCLYSSALSLSTIFTRAHLWQITLGIGIVGTILALFNVEQYFISFLVLLGVAIPPIAAIYVLDMFIVRRGNYNEQALADAPAINVGSFAAWGLGILVGYLASENILSLSGIASIDSILVSSVSYALFKSHHLLAVKSPA